MTTSRKTGHPQVTLPGRLGDPGMVLKNDPRVHPQLLAAMAPFGLGEAPPPAPVNRKSSYEEKVAYLAESEPVNEQLFAMMCQDVPPILNVEHRTVTINGVDGNEIGLFIHRPKDISGNLPCIYHIHGGGMVLFSAEHIYYRHLRDELCAMGMAVVGVEFRNGGGKLGNHPFPAGLNDCTSGLIWTFENKAALNIDKVVVAGESGGGNLSLAVCLKAKQDGRFEQIDGVYAMCPYISNGWAEKNPELPSLHENDNYFLSCSGMAWMATVYDPGGRNDNNPLCWPYCATEDDLMGLPPHVISVNELDPLRDEGLAYYRKLAGAGVEGYSRTVNGTCHAGDLIFRKAIPDVFASTMRDIKGFVQAISK